MLINIFDYSVLRNVTHTQVRLCRVITSFDVVGFRTCPIASYKEIN